MSEHKYFMGGTTAKGYVNFYENLIEQLDYVLYIEGGHTSLISPLLKDVADQMKNQLNIDYIYNHIQQNELEGIVFTELNAGIFDRSKMNIRRMKWPLIKESLLFCGEGYDKEGLIEKKQSLVGLEKEIEEVHTLAVQSFQEALAIHHEVEGIYGPYMNFAEANRATDHLKVEIFENNMLNKPSSVHHRYLGAATPEGPVDFIQNLTNQANRRIFMKGTSGSGKSTILRKIAREAQERGFDVEVYHCGFDPTSLDMVILPELGLSIFDATAPHEHHPNLLKDEEYNLSEKFMTQPVSKKDQQAISILKIDYRLKVDEATAYLKQVNKLHEEFEKIYQDNMIPEFYNVAKEELLNWVDEKK
ncbi:MULTISPECIES: hypothetical protein [Allobacillus]|uniref:ATPase n=1 Tax=Allobacillus salarius TaxID=1955272 RepID=A0A556PH08_9BACI|nr:hypothetical protein [Allobacillus salarius]TSJ63663.1 hypothetical protein FPQ13_08670 [Allobacillus salarius]